MSPHEVSKDKNWRVPFHLHTRKRLSRYFPLSKYKWYLHLSPRVSDCWSSSDIPNFSCRSPDHSWGPLAPNVWHYHTGHRGLPNTLSSTGISWFFPLFWVCRLKGLSHSKESFHFLFHRSQLPSLHVSDRDENKLWVFWSCWDHREQSDESLPRRCIIREVQSQCIWQKNKTKIHSKSLRATVQPSDKILLNLRKCRGSGNPKGELLLILDSRELHTYVFSLCGRCTNSLRCWDRREEKYLKRLPFEDSQCPQFLLLKEEGGWKR